MLTYKSHIKLSLSFPEEEIGYLDEMYLKNFFISYFNNICGMFIKDGFDDKTDGLVYFGVEYNHVWKTYSFSFCGGTRYEEKAQEVKKHFKELGYKCGELENTWVVEHNNRPCANGLKFDVKK